MCLGHEWYVKRRERCCGTERQSGQRNVCLCTCLLSCAFCMLVSQRAENLWHRATYIFIKNSE